MGTRSCCRRSAEKRYVRIRIKCRACVRVACLRSCTRETREAASRARARPRARPCPWAWRLGAVADATYHGAKIPGRILGPTFSVLLSTSGNLLPAPLGPARATRQTLGRTSSRTSGPHSLAASEPLQPICLELEKTYRCLVPRPRHDEPRRPRLGTDGWLRVTVDWEPHTL